LTAYWSQLTFEPGASAVQKFAVLIAFFGLMTMTGWAQSTPDFSQSRAGQERMAPEPPMLGPHMVRGAGHGHNPFGGGGSPDMTYHNGPILPTTQTFSIFWGKSWGSYSGDKITGLDTWYGTVGTNPLYPGGDSYARTSDEYTDSTSTHVTSQIGYLGHAIDTSAAPSKAPSTSAILNEVCKVVSNPTSNAYYAVYVDTKRGHANYCAWHSWGSCGGTPIQFAFFFNLDGDSGCDPQASQTGNSQGLDALANVTGHELSEARTDPTGSAWYDGSGAENADKCAWAFSGSLLSFDGIHKWKIQGNWSNYAYDHQTGYANQSGQPGCLDGSTNYQPVAP
jgi:hypothetical protein